MNSIEEIKTYIVEKTKLEDLISEDLDLKRQSGRMTGCCPFHEENTPSFYVFSDHYHCFGCGAHGDVINYVREKRGLGFIESLKWLGEKLGIDCQVLFKNRNENSLWKKTARYSDLYALAQKFFVEKQK